MIPRLRKMLKGAVRRIRRPAMRHLRRHGLILMYHRIAEIQHDPWQLCVTPAHFRQHLQVLTKIANVVPLEEFTARLQFARSKRPTVAITFDDGYLDNYSEALPLLQEFKAPATFFISTDAVGRNEPFWWDVLSELTLTAALPPQNEIGAGTSRFRWQIAGKQITIQERRTLHHALWARLQVLDEAQRRSAIKELCALASFDPGPLVCARAMNVQELRQVHASGLVEIGAHSLSHCPLPKRDAAEQRREILGSMQQCQALLGRLPTSFAYPYGAFDSTSRDLAAECGFERACTSEQDLVWAKDDRMLLSRFSVPDIDAKGFERRFRDAWLE